MSVRMQPSDKALGGVLIALLLALAAIGLSMIAVALLFWWPPVTYPWIIAGSIVTVSALRVASRIGLDIWRGEWQ